MQKNSYEEFDLQLRKVFEDAGEPAPSGIWESISSRLDAIDAASAAGASSGSSVAGRSAGWRRGWYWAAASLAAAAAVAFGIFFTGTSDNSDLINIIASESLVSEQLPVEGNSLSDNELVADYPENLRIVNKQLAQNQIVGASAQPAATSEPATASQPSAHAEPAQPVATSESAVIGQPGETGDTAAPGQSVASRQSAATGQDSDSLTDVFAKMAYEDSRSKNVSRRLSAVIGGSINNNNASQGTGARGAGGSYLQNDITETSKSDFGIPVTFGLGVRLHLNDRLAIGTGLDYSLLARTFEGVYSKGATPVAGDIRHTIQYVGIPLDVFYALINSQDILLYSMAGLEAEHAVSNRYSLLGTGDSVSSKVKGIQWSAGAGLGVEFSLGDRAGLFVEPSARYYFNCDQPKNIRTDKPFQFVLRAGLRFDL